MGAYNTCMSYSDPPLGSAATAPSDSSGIQALVNLIKATETKILQRKEQRRNQNMMAQVEVMDQQLKWLQQIDAQVAQLKQDRLDALRTDQYHICTGIMAHVSGLMTTVQKLNEEIEQVPAADPYGAIQPPPSFSTIPQQRPMYNTPQTNVLQQPTSYTNPAGYQPPAPTAAVSSYQQPAAQMHQQPAAQTYQQPSVQTYQQPAAQTYQQPAAQTYHQPAAQTYQQPAAPKPALPPQNQYQNPMQSRPAPPTRPPNTGVARPGAPPPQKRGPPLPVKRAPQVSYQNAGAGMQPNAQPRTVRPVTRPPISNQVVNTGRPPAPADPARTTAGTTNNFSSMIAAGANKMHNKSHTPAQTQRPAPRPNNFASLINAGAKNIHNKSHTPAQTQRPATRPNNFASLIKAGAKNIHNKPAAPHAKPAAPKMDLASQIAARANNMKAHRNDKPAAPGRAPQRRAPANTHSSQVGFKALIDVQRDRINTMVPSLDSARSASAFTDDDWGV